MKAPVISKAGVLPPVPAPLPLPLEHEWYHSRDPWSDWGEIRLREPGERLTRLVCQVHMPLSVAKAAPYRAHGIDPTSRIAAFICLLPDLYRALQAQRDADRLWDQHDPNLPYGDAAWEARSDAWQQANIRARQLRDAVMAKMESEVGA